MSKLKSFTYIIDGLSTEKGEKIKKALQNIPEIKSITVDATQGTVELLTNKDFEVEMKYACDIAGASFRVQIKNKKRLFS